jgi:sugar lactone lactonase YvrE
VEENRKPLGSPRVAFEVEDPLLIPEGITYDPAGDVFFLSSIHRRAIVKVARDGTASDFAAGDSGYFAGLGMKVDAARRRLWSASSVFPGMQGYAQENEGTSSLSCYDLPTGRLLKQVVAANVPDRHIFNDVALDAEGRAYLTDTQDGALYLAEWGSDTLGVFLPKGTLSGANGIALDGERNLLYVSQYGIDIALVDLKDKTVHALQRENDVALYGVDGLYLHGGDLIAVQNHPSLDRIARFSLSADGRSVTGAEVLVRRHESFEEPTTGVVVGDRFYFIANSQIERFTNMEDPDSTMLDPVRVLEIGL